MQIGSALHSSGYLFDRTAQRSSGYSLFACDNNLRLTSAKPVENRKGLCNRKEST